MFYACRNYAMVLLTEAITRQKGVATLFLLNDSRVFISDRRENLSFQPSRDRMNFYFLYYCNNCFTVSGTRAK